MGRLRRPHRDAPYNEYDASACGGYFGARAPKCAYSLFFFLTHDKKYPDTRSPRGNLRPFPHI